MVERTNSAGEILTWASAEVEMALGVICLVLLLLICFYSNCSSDLQLFSCIIL